MKNIFNIKNSFLIIFIIKFSFFAASQTLTDGIFMPKKTLCAGINFNFDSWDEYWEGTLLRKNPNLGTLQTQAIGLGGTYGITNRLNFSIGAPFIRTKSTGGQITGQRGFQDLTAGFKVNLSKTALLGGNFYVDLAAAGSLPISNYTPDLLPYSIGLQAKTASIRPIFYWRNEKNWNATMGYAYIFRSNVKLDRTFYYTDHAVHSNVAAMPNQTNFSAKAGYYSFRWAFELAFEQMKTLGGHDISRNNMPFVSNKMNASHQKIARFANCRSCYANNRRKKYGQIARIFCRRL
jgi:hypothetical protein